MPLSFLPKKKKKDKDKAGETKEERRERRRREKAEKEKLKLEKRAQVIAAQEPAISDIVAGSGNEEDKKGAGRFSFRKRKYDVDHEVDSNNPSPSLERAEFLNRESRSGSDSGSIGATRYRTSGDRDSSLDKLHENNTHNGGFADHRDGAEPVAKPRTHRKSSKTSSLDIKLKNGSRGSESGEDGQDTMSYTSDRSDSVQGRNRDDSFSRGRNFEGSTAFALSGTPKKDSIKREAPANPPPKPPRVVQPDESGMVELKFINAGGSRRTPRHEQEIKVSSSVNSYSAPPQDLSFMDTSMENKPIYDEKVSREYADGVYSQPEVLVSPTEKSFESLGVDLQLPEVVPASPGAPRIIRIKRRSSGDFGFALRRGTTPGRGDKTVHFVEPVGPNTVKGILPGDRLIEVNGTNVEDIDREKIIEMIAMSGEEVVIKVLPVSELSELSVRSGLDGSFIQLDDSNLKAGTLQRSGSKRMKKKPKSVEEVASNKAWHDAEKVWVVHKAGFSGGRVLRLKPSEGANEDEMPMCQVKLDHGGELITIEEENIEKANPPQYDRAEDLATLRYLNESSCLHTLRQRYGSNLIHTYAGPNMIVINPQQQLAIYTDKVIQMFRGCKQEDMPPHIFATAQTAYRNMLATRIDQSVVLMGSSGSGKTTCAKHILHYLSSIAGSSHSPVTDQNFEGIFALLESFGNVQTILNRNATRFTLLVSLDFDSAGGLTCGSLQTFLLEKSRVVRQKEGEGTFNIFYYLLSGSDPKLRKELLLDAALKEPNDFILGFDPASVDSAKCSVKWTELEFALNMLGISADEAKAIWSTLAAIYHLGSAGVTIGADSKPYFANPAAIQRAATVLGTTPEELSEIIFAPPPINQFTIRMRNKAESLSTSPSPTSSGEPSPEKQARGAAANFIEALEGFAMGMYQEMFNALIRLINRALQCSVRSVTTIHVLDSPGFQNAMSMGRDSGASFEDLCHNYECERLQKFFHHTVFTQQMERYGQENIECSYESESIPPDPVVKVFDRAAQGVTRGSTLDLKSEQKGLLWILDEESIFPGANDSSFLARLYVHHCSEKESWVKQGPKKDTFYVNHCQGTLPVLYNAQGWLKLARENATTKQARGILADSTKNSVNSLFSQRNTADSISRSRSFKRATMSPPTAIKKNSQCLQLIYQVDTLLDAIRKTKVNFVRTILPVSTAGQTDITDPITKAKVSKEMATLDVPMVRQQLRSAEMLDAVRIHRQGFPEHMPFGEFRRRFDVLAPVQYRTSAGPVLDEKKGVELLLSHLELDQRSYRLGLSQIFFRAGSLAQLEDARDQKTTGTIVELQAYCRGFLARKRLKKLQVQNKAMICIQRNIRKFMAVRSWSWWKLYTKVLPLLNVHRTEEELKSKSGEVDILKAKVARLENENKELNDENMKLEQKVSELSVQLSEDRAAANHASQMLEQETMERMRLEVQLQEIQESLDEIKKKKEQLEVELLEAKALVSTSARRGEARLLQAEKSERFAGEGASDDEDFEEEEEYYRERYLQASREHEQLRKKLQSQAEKEMEEVLNQKRIVERKLAEEQSENDELHRQMAGLKKKSSRLAQEKEDMKLLLEEEQTRNTDLEKKQRKFDIESNHMKQEVEHERMLKDKINREKKKFQADKYRLEQELDQVQEDLDRATKDKHKLEQDLLEFSKEPGGEVNADAVALKRQIRELEQKVQDQEEELDEQAGQIQILEQTKLRLEMAGERDKQLISKELEAKEEELEEVRYSMQKKIKQLEAQLEEEYQEKTSAIKAKRDIERRIEELRDQFARGDAETERRLRRELKRTKALLRDAQTVIDTQEQKLKDRNQMKALKDRLEDLELEAHNANKSKKKVEVELAEVQAQLDLTTKGKIEFENKYFAVMKENTELQSRVDEDEEDIENLETKNRQLLKELSLSKDMLREHQHQLQDLTIEKEELEAKVMHMASRLAYLEESTVDKTKLSTMDSKMKELETKLDFEGSFKKRQDMQVTRLKEQVQRLQDERDDGQLRETKLQQENTRYERQMREMREEMSALEKREEDMRKRKSEVEGEIENLEAQLSLSKQELNLSKKRVAELQRALEDDMLDSDGIDDSDLSDGDLDITLETASRGPSEPRSYRSLEDLDDDSDLQNKLKSRLTDLADGRDERSSGLDSPRSLNSPDSVTSPDGTRDEGKPKKSAAKKEHSRSREERRKKSIEKRKSQEKMNRRAKPAPGSFDI
ncbi:unconventional myosin-XVIIIa-like isoform X2 [Nematostella vectensis]|uniref:unconventional myosin-XVIIIa-like isoform X2 n=1 Tax=Nematostella vectensis TaxID=45351 RepID=UPI00207725E1|nr:unconventional myosin-XVIIIa-like isoform X2 [Nematostella vectensis]